MIQNSNVSPSIHIPPEYNTYELVHNDLLIGKNESAISPNTIAAIPIKNRWIHFSHRALKFCNGKPILAQFAQ